MNDDNTIAPSEGTPDKKAQQKQDEPVSDDWKKIVDNKYKTEAELAKAYKELESKLGANSEEVRKTREFAENIQPLLEEIRNDPEIFARLDERLRKKGTQTENKPNANGETDDVRDSTSGLILAKFEEKHGIDKLSPEERKDIRQKIGDVIVSLTGTSFKSVDLRRLGDVLENAYFLANKDKLMEQSKLEALAKARETEEGAISSLSSSQEKGETTLTSEEAKVAERLGLTRDQYIEGKKGPAKSK